MEARNNAVEITPQALPKVFVSYKTVEHQQYVTAIRRMLVDDGFPVWLDERNHVPHLRSLGLDNALRGGLRSADVLLFLVPRQEYRPTGWGRAKDILDSISLAFFTEYGDQPIHLFLESQIVWHKLVYGIDTRKKESESWQQWERRNAGNFGIPVIPVRILEDTESATIAENDTCLLRAQYLAEDLALQVKPKLISRSKEKRGIETEIKLIEWLQRKKPYILLFLGLLICYLNIRMAVESVKNAVVWLPRRVWRLLGSAIRKISAK